MNSGKHPKQDPRHRRAMLAVAAAIGVGILAAISGAAQSGASGAWHWTSSQFFDDSKTAGHSLVTASVEHDFRDGSTVCGAFLSELPPSKLPVPKDLTNRGLHNWSIMERAPEMGASVIDVILQNPSQDAIVLRGAEVHIVSRRATIQGNQYYTAECGGGMGPRYFRISLDSAHPTVNPQGGTDGPPQEFPFKISGSDPEDLRFTASCISCGSAKWYLTVEYVADGKSGEIRISDKGQPFETVENSPSQKVYVLSRDGRTWK